MTNGEYRRRREYYNKNTHRVVSRGEREPAHCERCGAGARELFDRTCVQQQILNLVKNPPVNVTAQGQQLPNK